MRLTHIETTAHYAEYERRFAAFMQSEGINNLSTQEDQPEPFFSWSPCDCCHRPLGGDRYTCSGYNPTTKEVQSDYAICVDCYYYAEYGQLDDQTMLDLKDENEA